MINTSALKGVIAENNLSQAKMARKLGISEQTFYAKMKKGVFNSNEIYDMMSILNIDLKRANDIFFTKKSLIK